MIEINGEIKLGWKHWRFDQIATNVNDRIDNPANANVEYYVGLEHLDSESLKIRRWGQPEDVNATKLKFKKGDIIFGRRRAYQRKLAVADFDGICSAHAMVLRPNTDAVVPGFLSFFMQSDTFMDRALKISVGSLSPTINWKTLAAQKFWLPPIGGQRKTLQFLESIENEYESLKNVEITLGKLRASLAVEYFASPEIQCGELIKMGALSLQTGPFGTVLKASAYQDSGYPIINPVNMVNGELNIESGPFINEEDWRRLEKYWMREGDMIIGRKGDMRNLVFVGPVYDKFVVGSDCIRFRVDPSKINQRYFFHFLRAETTQNWLQGQAYGTVMPGINEKIIARLMTFIPDLLVQERISDHFDKLESSLSVVKNRISSNRFLKKSVLKILYTGE